MNSTLAQYTLKLINPTLHVQVGDLARLPVPDAASDVLRDLVDQAIALARADSEEDETTWDFIAPPDWRDGFTRVAERHARLAEIEREIDEEVYRLYGISEEDRRAIEAELGEGVDNHDHDESGTADHGSESQEVARQRTARQELARQWISYAVGIGMGQFHPGVEGSPGCGRFAKEFAVRLRALTDADGVLVVDPGYPDELATKVLTVLEIILGEDGAVEVVTGALGNRGETRELLRAYLADKFFKEHTKKYRKRPIYWYLRSAKSNYGLWLYYHRLDKDILFRALINYVEPKIRLEENRINTLRSRRRATGSSGREAKQFKKDIDRQEQLLSELREFKDKLRCAADLHLDFDLNDGVILNMAPLWELIPWKEPQKYWEELQEGACDWSHIAYQLWPDRVEELCRRDRSIAMAHGREDLREVEPPNSKRKRPVE